MVDILAILILLSSSWRIAYLPKSTLVMVTALSTPPYPTSMSRSRGDIAKEFFSLNAVPGADIEQETDDAPQPQVVGDNIIYRGKVNEIDYCIAPADVSLSRAYGKNTIPENSGNGDSTSSTTAVTPQTMSLTQALNNASNRAVRRILLAKCWPSEEKLNLSLRLAAVAEKQAEEARKAAGSTSTAKCPVPRPILNLLMRRGDSASTTATVQAKDASSATSHTATTSSSQSARTRTMEQYVNDQIKAFRERYGSLAGYNYAEAYLESILSLATTGQESPRVKDVLESKVYDESYRRVISVLKSVGVVFEQLPDSDRFQLAAKLKDVNFCLSMMDILEMKKETSTNGEENVNIETVNGSAETFSNADEESAVTESEMTPNGNNNRLKFWQKKNGKATAPEEEQCDSEQTTKDQLADDGRVILCSEEPSMTRQLNALSNVVHRGLLYGGDQELLVLSETLADNRQTFVQRWYPNTGEPIEIISDETRPGVQYLNALIALLRQAYDEGIVTNLDPMVPLNLSYANSYERLMASLVEQGSGYVRPETADVLSMPKPRTAQEELGRFAVWESAFRSKNDEETSYPEDLEGTWEVKDEVGGETIGTSTVTLAPKGEVIVAPPLQGLRWRLDPGPTHLDTCTFQVLSEDGTILQYRGFLDRGARLEARFSGRPTRIRGSVMFQMRYGGTNYWKDMLPVNYKTGATKFEMIKQGSDK
ncbi:hypothetical protein IV203_036170 [Nitzschia inconspicua]|uniref:Uncharacterized protein n=1 Tax=Nitzschia inconspicua TaxID=303405 RepID=A0A9K3LEN8_9STRA|nr:hypothetical protein IV203_036170 [Nitzschia inconspicua]